MDPEVQALLNVYQKRLSDSQAQSIAYEAKIMVLNTQIQQMGEAITQLQSAPPPPPAPVSRSPIIQPEPEPTPEPPKVKAVPASKAKKAGFKSTQGYVDTMARYGGESNYKKGRGLGT